MNAYKLNGIAGHCFRMAICKFLNIHWSDVYKTVKTIHPSNKEGEPVIIETKEGKKYELTLKEITT